MTGAGVAAWTTSRTGSLPLSARTSVACAAFDDPIRLCVQFDRLRPGYADLKTYLRGRQQIMRSKDPGPVAQELYALLIVCQLVQLARIKAAGNRPRQEPLDPAGSPSPSCCAP